jgi:phenylpropionate dioxygenase-like ring-hydroxylating dioxygenase large terminal subunit
MKTTRSAEGAKALPREYYTSESVFDLETERIFRSHWLCAGRAAELAAGGSYLLFELDGESLFLLRDADGVRGYYNVCRHRGTRLCEEPRGSLGKTIRCPYHAWTYGLDGELVAAPNMKDVDGFDRADYPLHPVATAVWEGFLFVNLSRDAEPIKDEFQPLAGRFDAWELSELVVVDRHVYDVRANWKMLFQNYSECYHCPRIHPALNALSGYSTASNDVMSGPFLGGPMQLADGVASMSATGAACGDVFATLSTEDRRRVYYYSLFPTLLLAPHPDYVLVHRIERQAVDRTRVVCEFLFPPAVVERPGFDPAPAVEFWDTTNHQDWHACELSQAGVSSRSYVPGPYSNLECTLAAFDRHYLQTLGGAPQV